MRTLSLGIRASNSVDEWAGFYFYAPTTGINVYVSTSGSDANSGLTSALPKLTLSAGLALLTSGQPDRLWLKRGDEWTNEEIGAFAKNGLSATEPMIIGAYGAYTLARPKLTCNGLFMSAAAISFVVIQDLNLELEAGRTNTGVGCFSNVNVVDTFVVQGCRIHNFGLGLELDGNSTGANVVIHRNVISDIWSDNNSAQGILAREMAGALTITGNTFDRCGYATSAMGTGNGVARNIYIQTNCVGTITQEDNWSVRSASNGAQFRAGGSVKRNGFVSNVDGFTWGLVTGGTAPHAAITTACEDNYVDNSLDLPSLASGFGIQFGNCAPGATFRRNLVTNCSSAGSNAYGVSPTGSVLSGASTQPITGVDIRDNVVFETERPLLISGTMATQITGTVIEDNEWGTSLAGSTDYAMQSVSTIVLANVTFSANAYQSGRAASSWINNGGTTMSVATWDALNESDAIDGIGAYTASTRTVATYRDMYLATTGSTRADFFTNLRAQRRGAWNEGFTTREVLDWIRAGFDMPAIA